MNRTPKRLTSKPTFLVTQLATYAHRLASEAFERAGARPYHYRVLAALDELGPLSQADLGRSVHMDRSDVVAAVNRLTEAGHVERRSDPTDARVRIVRLTASGRRQLARLERELAIAQRELLEPLDDRSKAVFTRLSLTLLEHHAARRYTER